MFGRARISCTRRIINALTGPSLQSFLSRLQEPGPDGPVQGEHDQRLPAGRPAPGEEGDSGAAW